MKAASVSQEGRYGQYCCYRRRDYGNTELGCDGPRIAIDKADEAVLNSIVELLQEDGLVDRLYDCVRRLLEDRNKATLDEPTPEDKLRRVISDIDAWFARHDATDVKCEKEAAWNRIRQLSEQKAELERQVSLQQKAAKPEPELLVTREQVADYLSNLADELMESRDRGNRLIRLLCDFHGLEVSIIDAESIRVSMQLHAPGTDESDLKSICVPVEVTTALPKGTVDAWIEQHQGQHHCAICGEQIEILRRHYWHGIPKNHHKCWASQLTAKRSNPDPEKYYNGRQVAELFGVGQSTVGRWTKSGQVARTNESQRREPLLEGCYRLNVAAKRCHVGNGCEVVTGTRSYRHDDTQSKPSDSQCSRSH